MRNFNIFLESGEKINLTEHDLSNSGGEGEIFIKGDYAYKIFFDQSKTIERNKILELSSLNRDNIIRPIQSIFNESKEQIGYQMKAIFPDKCFPLTRFFTTDFRIQHNVTNEQVSHIIKELYLTFEFIHNKDFLIVDGNEMNFLLSDDFKNIYFIDVDSYKTPSFKPTAYNPNTLDPKITNQEFNTGSDWYIFGILFCQILLGIHPFKGKYTGTSKSFGKRDIVKRMKEGVSILNPKVKLNKAVRNISLIPKRMKEWLNITFTSNTRVKPPLLAEQISAIYKEVNLFNVPNGFKVFEVDEFKESIELIKRFEGDYIYKNKGFYYSSDDKLISKADNLVFLIDSETIAFSKLVNGNVEIFIPKLNIKQTIMNNVENLYVFNDRLFSYKNNKISSVDMILGNNKVITGIGTSWDLFLHHKINEFVLFYQSGKRKAYYFYEDNKNAIIDLEEMVDNDEKIINIKGYDEYIVIKTFKNNEYYCKIFSMNLFTKHAIKIHESICFDISINFLLNNNLLIGEVGEDELIVGYMKEKDFKHKTIKDFSLDKEFINYKGKLSFIDQNKIYNLSMK